MLKRLQIEWLAIFAWLESALIGLFFIEALRFLVGMLYSRVAGASTVLTLYSLNVPIESVTAPNPSLVQTEITISIYLLLLPLIGVLLGRIKFLIPLSVVGIAVARALMTANLGLTQTASAALVVSIGLLYFTLIARHRATQFPYIFVLGLSLDQILRAYGNTLDPSWQAGYINIQFVLSGIVILFALILAIQSNRRVRNDENGVDPDQGLLPFWSGIGIGALLFLQLSLLAVPNAIAGRADVDYTTFVPLVLGATLLPIVPFFRSRARGFIALFDGGVRGWIWMLLAMLLLIFGTRLQGIIAGVALVIAQFAASMLWWWFVRPRMEKERYFGGLWLILAAVIFGVFVVADNFTYEYAFVREFTGNLRFLNNAITPLLRGFRGFGVGVILVSLILATLPMIQARRRIAWVGDHVSRSILNLLFVVVACVTAAYFARPPLITSAVNSDELRVGTYNIHSGFDEYYVFSLEEVAQTIHRGGTNMVLLQEVDAGRLTSFGVDQSLWLARRLGYDRRFYPTNEGLQGLAVLSQIPIAYDDGVLLTSNYQQTGLQRVQIQPAPNTVITVYNTWLSPLFEVVGSEVAEQEQDQQQQLNEIFALIASHHPNGVLGRTIIGGTFNNVPDSPLIQQMRSAGFNDPFAGLTIELSATLVRTGVNRARFDYIFTRNLDALGVVVINSEASDHRMAVVGLRITR